MAIVLAYHGCSKDTAQKLLSGSSFALSDKPYDWLGKGAYFWEGDITRAYEWASERPSESTCVVGAIIELGHCLDLTTRTGAEVVAQAYRSYALLQQSRGLPLPVNRAPLDKDRREYTLRFLDKVVIDHLHFSNGQRGERRFDTVRALFPEGQPLYPGAGFLAKTHVQLAVRRPEQIRGVFRVPARELAELSLPDIYNGS